jgi:YD repeat-containing protein
MDMTSLKRVGYIALAVAALCLISTASLAGKVYFNYDPLGQLTNATAVSNGTAYSYDTSGNLRHVESSSVDLRT